MVPPVLPVVDACEAGAVRSWRWGRALRPVRRHPFAQLLQRFVLFALSGASDRSLLNVSCETRALRGGYRLDEFRTLAVRDPAASDVGTPHDSAENPKMEQIRTGASLAIGACIVFGVAQAVRV